MSLLKVLLTFNLDNSQHSLFPVPCSLFPVPCILFLLDILSPSFFFKFEDRIEERN